MTREVDRRRHSRQTPSGRTDVRKHKMNLRLGTDKLGETKSSLGNANYRLLTGLGRLKSIKEEDYEKIEDQAEKTKTEFNEAKEAITKLHADVIDLDEGEFVLYIDPDTQKHLIVSINKFKEINEQLDEPIKPISRSPYSGVLNAEWNSLNVVPPRIESMSIAEKNRELKRLIRQKLPNSTFTIRTTNRDDYHPFTTIIKKGNRVLTPTENQAISDLFDIKLPSKETGIRIPQRDLNYFLTNKQ